MTISKYINEYPGTYINYMESAKDLDKAIDELDDYFQDITTINHIKHNITKYGLCDQMSSYLCDELGFKYQLTKKELLVALEGVTDGSESTFTKLLNWLKEKLSAFLDWLMKFFGLKKIKADMTASQIANDDPKQNISAIEIPKGIYNKETMKTINDGVSKYIDGLNINTLNDLFNIEKPQDQIYDAIKAISEHMQTFVNMDLKLHFTFKDAGINTVSDLQKADFKSIIDKNLHNDAELIRRIKLFNQILKKYDNYFKQSAPTEEMSIKLKKNVRLLNGLLENIRKLQTLNNTIFSQYSRLRNYYAKKAEEQNQKISKLEKEIADIKV